MSGWGDYALPSLQGMIQFFWPHSHLNLLPEVVLLLLEIETLYLCDASLAQYLLWELSCCCCTVSGYPQMSREQQLPSHEACETHIQ